MVARSRAATLAPESRYELLLKIASGGMSTVYVGRLRAAAGVSRLVAIKRAHEHVVEDLAARSMLAAEARLAAKIHHPNVAAVQDVEQLDDELLLVMDYVEGASFEKLILAADERGERVEPACVVRVVLDVCQGLQAAHELHDERGAPLRLVHRDVSPHNVLVGVDGVARIGDFGVAKSIDESRATHTGTLKGKIAYMAPEYLDGGSVDARVDVFGVGVVLWEALAGRRLFQGNTMVETLRNVLELEPEPLRAIAPDLPPAIDEVVHTALSKDPSRRWRSSQALAEALESAARPASLVATASVVARAVHTLVGAELVARRLSLKERLDAATDAEGDRTPPMDALRYDPARALPEEASATMMGGERATREVAAAETGIEVVRPLRRARRMTMIAATLGVVLAVGWRIARDAASARTSPTSPAAPVTVASSPALPVAPDPAAGRSEPVAPDETRARSAASSPEPAASQPPAPARAAAPAGPQPHAASSASTSKAPPLASAPRTIQFEPNPY
jgi:serine/threonine-protein kinase